MVSAPREKLENMAWFMAALDRNMTKPDRCTIERTEDDVAGFLAYAYKYEVRKRAIPYNHSDRLEKMLRIAARWMTSHNKNGLLISGGVGCGKTTLANAISDVYMIVNRNGIRTEDAKTIAAMALDDKKEYEVLRGVRMLCIDDMGTELITAKSYGNEVMPVVDIIHYRYAKQLFTIITTNLTEKQIEDTYGSRVADRLREMCSKITIGTDSYRK